MSHKLPADIIFFSLIHTVLCCCLNAQTAISPTSISAEASHRVLFEPQSGPFALKSKNQHSNFRLSLSYSADASSKPQVILLSDYIINLPTGEKQNIDIAFERMESTTATVRIWHDGELIKKDANIPKSLNRSNRFYIADQKTSENTLDMGSDFTAMVKFATKKNGTLMAKTPSQDKWVSHSKALFINKGRLAYGIGQLGRIEGKTNVCNGKQHVAVLRVKNGSAAIYLDGQLEAKQTDFTRPDAKQSIFKIGSAIKDFSKNFEGSISNLRFWKRALNDVEIKNLSLGNEDKVNTPDFHWKPSHHKSVGIPGRPTFINLKAGNDFELHSASVQPLSLNNHAAIIGNWNDDSLKRGEKIYKEMCVICHGDLTKAGSLPTAMRFHQGKFKNGADPYRIYQTLVKGYGQMAPQPQYTTKEKYDVIHYIRETFLKDHNESELTKINDSYLAKLPLGMSTKKEKPRIKRAPQYLLQDFGNTLFWTLQVDKANIAQKGIAIRMDNGPGGITKGKSWMLYDHDTMRLAACWSGDQFVDWRGIAFDGSHGTHTSIVGDKHYTSPNLPMWANPETGKFDDVRVIGRDGRPYGPLPRQWVHFKALEHHDGYPVIRYTVGDCNIRELPGIGKEPNTFTRTFFCGPTSKPLKLRLDKDNIHTLPASQKMFTFAVLYANGKASVIPSKDIRAAPGAALSNRFKGRTTSEIVPGDDSAPYAIDTLTLPAMDKNPWQSWMRSTGVDFFKNGKSAAVCTWNGDVWIVDGINQREGKLTWQRICSGLFQPLGIKIVEGEIYVGCRDMIAKLIDLNGDRETDIIESFNNDHQVTEHFHEFAMGLQTDSEGNFYYAKSARHAKVAVVPHHGTLLRVSKDGTKTDILATGFRAANGVCLNPDGSFIVTDQEGHWNPKNRINWVKGTGVDDFYGNMYGYHNVTDSSDSAMNPPLCWITNAFDRSPAELVWVPENSAWKSLRGSLLNLSYGAGKVYVVPHEKIDGQVQGGMCQLPFDSLPTGIMRGRFHSGDGQFYGCGMYAWAGNRKKPGGFYRIRATGNAANLPVGLSASTNTITVKFSDPLDVDSTTNIANWSVEAWDLKRTKKYGSKHYNQREWNVKKAALSPDRKTITLTIPDLAPTWGMSITANIKDQNGKSVTRVIHNTIHQFKP
jgi:cytochrome c5